MSELCLLWEVESTCSCGLWCNMWVDLKINIQMLPGNWDSSHSWSVISIQAKETLEHSAAPCECWLWALTQDHQVLRRNSQKAWSWTFGATKQWFHFHCSVNSTFPVLPHHTPPPGWLCCGQERKQATQPGESSKRRNAAFFNLCSCL